jgi:hypothetical protein
LKLKSQCKIAYGIWVVNFEGNWIPKLVPNQIVKMKFQINKSPNWNPKLYKSFKIGYYVEMSNWDSKLGCQID